MRTTTSRIAALIGTLSMLILLGGNVSPIHAQSEIGFKIPFDFYVGEHRFASGTYTVQVFSSYVKVRDEKGHSIFAITNPVDNPTSKDADAGALLFKRYDSMYFLSQVRRSGYSTGHELLVTPFEVQVAKMSTGTELIAYHLPQ